MGGTTLNGTYDGDDKVAVYGGAAYAHAAGGEWRTVTEGGETTTYDYDAVGNLRTVTLPSGTTLEYVIDGRNRRVGRKVNGTLTQGYLYDGQLRIVAELDGANNVTARYVYGTRVNVPEWLEKGGGMYRIITDHLGSPRLVVNATSGAIAQRMDYDSWGNITNDTNPGFQIFGYAGGLHDPDTKLTRYGARDYDARTGRWTAKDPIGFEGGDVNVYAYVENDPVNMVDLYGEDAMSSALSLGAGLVLIDGPLPVGDIVAAAIIAGTWGYVVWDWMNDEDDSIPLVLEDQATPLVCNYKEHSKNQRPSNLPKHERGEARRKKDRPGGEKGDERRDPYGKRPPGWKGPWPPK
ncbi:MAG: hypothetical protein IPP09_00355 [Elusimicrobia bacterium]|nr:hypothetical protein [Elusimicrobiota bacterium]MBK9921629.1 hypothetical protein [Elusimicrobiota bacterium]